MPLLRDLADLGPARGGMLSIGNFDGVHRGHQTMVARLAKAASAAGVPAVVLTFDPHPIMLLAPEKMPPRLSTLDRKAELLQAAGADFVIAVSTTRELLSLTAEEFFQQIIRAQINAVGMIEGPNFCFGKDRGGDIDLLQALCDEHAMTCAVLEPVAEQGGQMISSSLIRTAIAEGRLAEAIDWLGHSYQIRGQVVHGDARGRELGFPTANLADIATLLPPDGVYAGVTRVGEARYATAINIGGNPTFGIEARKVEAHLIGFDGDLYHQPLHVDLLDRVRGVVSFSGLDALQTQVAADINTVAQLTADHLS